MGQSPGVSECPERSLSVSSPRAGEGAGDSGGRSCLHDKGISL